MNIENRFLKYVSLATFAVLLTGCDAKDWVTGESSKAQNLIAKETKSCGSYKTDKQADGENHVILEGDIDYKFNLYWYGPDSKATFWEDKMINENYSFSYDPLKLNVLDGNNAVVKTVNCTENKVNAAVCLPALETVVKSIKDARLALTQRNANLSEGKGLTFQCTQKFAEEQITGLKAI